MKLRKFIYSTFIALLLSAPALAQGNKLVTGSPEFNPLNDKYTVASHEGKFHAIGGVKCTYSLASVDKNKYTIVSFVPRIEKKEGGEYSDVKVFDKQSAPFSVDIKESGFYRLVLDKLELKSKEGRDSICNYVIPVDSFDISVYSAPEKVKNDVENRKEEVIWSTTSRTLGAEYKGGYSEGWTYSWEFEELSTTGKEWTRNSFTVGRSTLKLTVKNTAPDGKTVWYDKSFTCVFDAKQTPNKDAIKLVYQGSVKGAVWKETMDWYCSDNENKVIVSTEGAGEYKWTYKWSQDGKAGSSTTSAFKPAMSETDVTDKSKLSTYTLSISCFADGMDESDESLAFKHTLSGKINFWKNPIVTIPSFDKEVFEGRDVRVDLTLSKNSMPCTERLYLVLSDDTIYRSSDIDSFSFKAQKVAQNSIEKEYMVLSRFEGTHSILVDKKVLPITIWRTPNLKRLYKSNNPDIANKEFDVKDTISVCGKFDGNVVLKINHEYGDPEGWRFIWNGEGSSVATYTVPVKEFVVGETKQYTVKVVNKPGNMKERNQHEESFVFKLQVCPTPTIEITGQRSVYAGVDGKELPLKLTGATGKGGHWEYTWNREGGEMTEGATLTLKNGTGAPEIQSWTACPRYIGPEGDVWYGQDKPFPFKVKVYPALDERKFAFNGFESNRIDAYYQGSTQYKVGFEIIDDYKYEHAGTVWNYTIKYNGLVKDDKSYHEIKPTLTAGEGVGKTKVSLEAICYIKAEDKTIDLDDSVEAYKSSRSLDYYAWRKGEVEGPGSGFENFVYYDSLKILDPKPKYGYQPMNDENHDAIGGWKFVWEQKVGAGEWKTIEATDRIFTHTNKNTDELRNMTCRVTCTNDINGEVGCSETVEFTFDEYAQIVESTLQSKFAPYVRKGDVVNLEMSTPKNGNPDGWWYCWADEGDTIHIAEGGGIPIKQVNKVKGEYNGDIERGTGREVTYVLHYGNDNPNGKRTFSKELQFRHIIYNKPKLEEFKAKGADNHSHIYYAKTSSKEVDFVFGEGTDAPEKISLIKVGEKEHEKNNTYAFYRFDHTPQKPWARTCWKFTYGGEPLYCYSDAAPTTGSAKAPSRELRVEGGHFSVNLEEEAAAIVTLHALNGQLVWEQHYAPQKDFDEKLDFGGVVSGMFILKCTVGEQQVVRKIVVR